MDFFTHFSGEFAALVAAFLWAFVSVIFKEMGKTIKPIELNLIKGIGGLFLFLVTSLLLKESVSHLPLLAVILLLISGAIGIGFGDTMYFEAINQIGPRRTLLISILAPLITAVLAFVFLGEKIATFAWLGVFITSLGIAWVIMGKQENQDGQPQINRKGILFAFLFAIAQSIGSVLSRWALTQTSISALQSSIIRMFAGILFLLIWAFACHIRLGKWMTSGREPSRMWGRVALVIILGAYFPLWLQQIAFQNTEVGIAQTILATSPLFVLPITALQKEKVAIKEILGVIISIAGIAILFLLH